MDEFEQRELPYATVVLILGILSILSCWCYGIPSIILSIIALVLYKQDKDEYDLSPSKYTNYSNLMTGKILAIIGLVLSILLLLFFIGIFAYIGFDAISDPELMQERIDELQ